MRRTSFESDDLEKITKQTFSSSSIDELTKNLCNFLIQEGFFSVNLIYHTSEKETYTKSVNTTHVAEMEKELVKYTEFKGYIPETAFHTSNFDGSSATDSGMIVPIKDDLELHTNAKNKKKFYVSEINDRKESMKYQLLEFKEKLAKKHLTGYLAKMVPERAKTMFNKKIEKYGKKMYKITDHCYSITISNYVQKQ